MVYMSEKNYKVGDYHSYCLILKSQAYKDDVASRMWKMRKDVAIQMEHQAFNGEDFILLINF